MNAPDGYRILLIDTPDNKPLVKVFASWGGGYLIGDEHRINSGTELITEDESHYFFHGFSGSIYKLNKYNQGHLTSYSAGIYNRILQQDCVKEISVKQAIDILKEGEQIDNS
jgi:hypothetical protein